MSYLGKKTREGPLLPCGNGGFGHGQIREDALPALLGESLLRPSYIQNAISASVQSPRMHEVGLHVTKNEPNWSNNNSSNQGTDEVDVKNFGALERILERQHEGKCDNDSASDVHNNLFVGNLPVNCSNNALYDLFSTYGNVVNVRIAKEYDLERQVLELQIMKKLFLIPITFTIFRFPVLRLSNSWVPTVLPMSSILSL